MLAMVMDLAQINTHTFNLPGLADMTSILSEISAVLEEKIEFHDLLPAPLINSQGEKYLQPLGRAISITKRSSVPTQVLLVCHMDTVHLPQSSAKVTFKDQRTLAGPGVADAKGGIVVMLKALEALERSPYRDKIGWKVVINSDEEIGSPGSTSLLLAKAKESHIGLVFEPSLSDGALVGRRKGSGNFTLIVRGRSAHAGRDYTKGRNAINALAECIVGIKSLMKAGSGLIINFGTVEGGKAVNIVPDLALTRFNVRVEETSHQEYFEETVKKIIDSIAQQDEVSVALEGGFTAPPKPLNGKTLELFKRIKQCAGQLGMRLELRDSGGVCDGNRLAAAGLPTIDSLGVCGGEIHTPNEYLNVESLVERTKLTALFLMKCGIDEWENS